MESVRDVKRKLAVQHTKQIQAKQYAALRDIAISRHMGYMVRHDNIDEEKGSCERNQNTHIAIARVPHKRSVHRLDFATRSSSSFFYMIEVGSEERTQDVIRGTNLDGVRVG